MKIDLAEVGEHAGGKPGSRHLRGVFCYDEFDKATADAGGYVISVPKRERAERPKRKPGERFTMQARRPERKPRKPGEPVPMETLPVLSVGAYLSDPGVFLFSIDRRFANHVGVSCIWSAGGNGAVHGAAMVSPAFVETVQDGKPVVRPRIEVTFRDGTTRARPPELQPVEE